jgi:hypothetical protein
MYVYTMLLSVWPGFNPLQGVQQSLRQQSLPELGAHLASCTVRTRALTHDIMWPKYRVNNTPPSAKVKKV